MENDKSVFQSDLFCVEHLDVNNEEHMCIIRDFRISAPEGQGLSTYLKRFACEDETNREMKTYLVRFSATGECVGYFSLKAGLVSVNETEVEITDEETGEKRMESEFDTVPGVELANFAVNKFLSACFQL